jgi:hypothetical protein
LFYETCLDVSNVPEFTKGPVHISPQALAKAAFSQQNEMITAKLNRNVLLNRNEKKSNPKILNE